MSDLDLGPLISTFFLLAAGVFVVLAQRFSLQSWVAFRRFGYGLGAYGISFLLVGLVVATRPTPLGLFIDLAMIPFLAGSALLLSAATTEWSQRSRLRIGLIAVAYLALLILLRATLFPSAPGFSPWGLIYFNAQPPVILLYIGALVLAVLPALQVVSRAIADPSLAIVTRIGFNAVVLGAVIMLVSYDDTLQLLNGFLIGGALAGLLLAYLSLPLERSADR